MLGSPATVTPGGCVMRLVVVMLATAAIVAAWPLQLSKAADVGPPPVYGYTPPPPFVPPPGLVVRVEPRCEPVWRCGAYGCGWQRVCAGGLYARPRPGPRPYYDE